MDIESLFLMTAPLLLGFITIFASIVCGIFAARARREARYTEAAFHSLISAPAVIGACLYLTHWLFYANDAACAPFPSTLRGSQYFAWFVALGWLIPAVMYARTFIRNYIEKVKLAQG